MIKSDQVYLEHILESIRKIEVFVNGLTKSEFDQNVMIQDAVIRNFEIIGEAVFNNLVFIKILSSVSFSGHPHYFYHTQFKDLPGKNPVP